MKSRNLKSAVFLFSALLFVFLLISGSPRLIGGKSEISRELPVRPLGSISAVLTVVPAAQAENTCPQIREQLLKKQAVYVAGLRQEPDLSVLSDANGNVLGYRSYIREVYQAFVLDDGFV